ncbi:MAG: glutamate/aspartate transport system substrate-binding protein, partial [Gammaproteobacteria bacterium]
MHYKHILLHATIYVIFKINEEKQLMKNIIKLTALSAVMLTGLSGQAIADAGDSRILKRIQDRGVVTIGHRETSIPFSYIGNDEKPVGYSID